MSPSPDPDRWRNSTSPNGPRPPLADEFPVVDWQRAMKRAIRSQSELRRRLGLGADVAADAGEHFPTFVPLELLARIKPGDPNDPILRQVLTTADESIDQPGFVADPVGDLQAEAGGGVLHKYAGRALIITHGACAVHCRYCFRREFPYNELGSRKQQWGPAIDYIRGDDSIHEVLLSGGDPLTLTDSALFTLLDQIESIPHVRRLRIHTRLPIAIPQRITTELADRLSESRLAVWFVIHANHANEIDDAVTESVGRLSRRGIPVLNQSVLLAGVNDDVDALQSLSLSLIDIAVQPYYLHQLDQVRGAGHFQVDVARGIELVNQLRQRLPGYAVPKYVVENAGEKSKTPIA
ncbi:EF-P beta-lysylation protein EpmB [Stieleria sp. TO1_6]|uniref:EF-P beta-lysylation protein EpmB n=1 Tax=Stieleria tagensis TaxID=2956795 RepID=UPI00209BAB34|nr:EF-P beta-lysylation protein EpmB [Stieleria tagensis]MCO8120965.1 EF-P beta-lysylation protein EpmB [Stieleria tagensis]